MEIKFKFFIYMNKTIKKNSVKARDVKRKQDINRFEKMFRDTQIDPSRSNKSAFFEDKSSTWIVSDNNSSFKSFVSHG